MTSRTLELVVNWLVIIESKEEVTYGEKLPSSSFKANREIYSIES